MANLPRRSVRRSSPAPRELIEMFDHLVEVSIEYRHVTGRFLPLFGELGELYAEIRFGIKRHRPMSQGSDGKIR